MDRSLSRFGLSAVFMAALLLCLPGCSHRAAKQPNIILLVLDAARADHFSCYGYNRQTTPRIDSLAQESLWFKNAVSSASYTDPAHASLFTGLLTTEHGLTAMHRWLVDRHYTLAERLSDAGYQTIGISNNPHVSTSRNLTQGFDIFIPVWADTSVTTLRKPHNAQHTNKLAIQYFQHKSTDKPVFMFINYMDVHLPYDPPAQFKTRFLDSTDCDLALVDSANFNAGLVNNGSLTLSRPEFLALRDYYDGALNYLDSRVGEFIDFLKQDGLYDNTLLVVTSDHGELFGRWNQLGHGSLLYRPLLNIPLIIHYPPLITTARVETNPVSICDIFYTILDLAGIDKATWPKTNAPVRILTEKIDPAPCYSEQHVISFLEYSRPPLVNKQHDMKSVWTPEGKHYIYTETEEWECYDLGSDFDEQHNLCPAEVTRNDVEAAIDSFGSRLVPFVERPDDLRHTKEIKVNKYQEEVLKTLGYVGEGSSESDNGNGSAIDYHAREHFRKGQFLYSRGNLEVAEKEFQKALLINPENTNLRIWCAVINYLQGDLESATKIISVMIKNYSPDDLKIITEGICLQKLGKQSEALDKYLTVYKKNPSRFDIGMNALSCSLVLKDYKTANNLIKDIFSRNVSSALVLIKLMELSRPFNYLEPACKIVENNVKPDIHKYVFGVLSGICAHYGYQKMAKVYLQKAETAGISQTELNKIKAGLSGYYNK